MNKRDPIIPLSPPIHKDRLNALLLPATAVKSIVYSSRSMGETLDTVLFTIRKSMLQ